MTASAKQLWHASMKAGSERCTSHLAEALERDPLADVELMTAHFEASGELRRLGCIQPGRELYSRILRLDEGRSLINKLLIKIGRPVPPGLRTIAAMLWSDLRYHFIDEQGRSQ
jgi:hypothetical protein